jgi:geranylgeranyl diphosphate synthase type II
MDESLLSRYLSECRDLVLNEIQQIVPQNRYRSVLYDLMLDYPLRQGKAFRPALCIAACRALGGRLQDVLRTATVLELYHNAFLLHDDVEDGSLMRRGLPTLHRDYGVPIAVNVGDGLNALCLQPLLDNMETLGLGKALRILQLIARMARESVEGQAVELDWVRRAEWQLRDRDYFLMCYKKTCWYTFIVPMQIGAIIAGASSLQLLRLRRYAIFVGLSFQIQDDVLNLAADEGLYGKEIGGDLWEGKRTLMLLHMMRSVTPAEWEKARRLLELPREGKKASDIKYLFNLIHRYGSIGYARGVALRLARKAEAIFRRNMDEMPASVHRDFLLGMSEHVITRDK